MLQNKKSSGCGKFCNLEGLRKCLYSKISLNLRNDSNSPKKNCVFGIGKIKTILHIAFYTFLLFTGSRGLIRKSYGQ